MTGCYAKAKLVRENVVRKLTGLPPIPEVVHIAYNPEHDGRRWVEWAQNADGYGGLRCTPVHEAIDRYQDEHDCITSPLIEHKGWFLDNEFQEDVVYGVVVQLPSHKGQRRYVPGVTDPFNPGCYLCEFTSWTTSLRDCIRRADRMAERYAEDEREYRERENG